ncbi:LGFP repeat-containing protein [Mycobacterium sp. DSM 3803]|nr:LGFP repeat-containing protein [Mycobacterium sp. DSM 3803]OKH68528.1 hypothetical protein EB73_15975 [Mycobacterium sp. SWH-M3]
MTTPAMRLNTAAWRIIVGLFAVAVVALLAPPPASASPESDADAAITAAWDASGGDGGPLGPREGGVYAAGAGFAQNLANGKIFFTPDTGAHYVQGAILEKYESLGGPDGDLGFPTIDEGAGRAPDSRNSTFSASDKPVIFWTPATGARVVRGAINAAWDKLGGSAGVLGVPTEDEAYRGDTLSQKFTGGELTWDRKTNTFTTTPPELADQLAGLAVPNDPASAIAAARRAAGGDMGPLGAKDGDIYPVGNTDGVAQNFARGKIFYTPETGANAITDQVLEKYESVGGPEGDMGFPTSSETEGGLGPNSRIATFAAPDKPVIFWTPDFGAVIVRGAMNAAWEKLGGAKGELGAPKGDQTENGSVVTQQFNGGSISWDRSDNTFTTEPPKLASELSGLEIPGLEQAPQQGNPPAANTDKDKPFSWHWSWWWLLALIPVLVVAGLIVGAAVWHRRRGRGDDDFDHDQFDDDEYDDDGGHYDDARYRETDGYDDDPYAQPRYDAPRYGDDDRSDDRPNPYEQADPFHGDEPTTAHFTGQYREPSAQSSPSPFDGPTDIAMPVSQWAAPGGFSTAVDEDDDEQPEEAVELFGGREDDHDDDFDEDEFEDDYESLDHDAHDEAVPTGSDERDDRDYDDRDYDDGRHDDALGAEPAHDDEAQFENSDDVDTAPTPVVTPAAVAAATPSRGDIHAETPSGRHAAIELDEPVTATALHMPLDDPQRAPQGYPIKADTKTGMYWSPDSRQYDDAVAEIWFASEEFARTNGFVRAD